MGIVDREEGIAYTTIAAFVFIVGGALVYIATMPMIDAALSAFSSYGDAGELSYQTTKMIEWNVSLYLAIPVIGLLGILVWAYIRGIEGRGF